MSWAQLFFDSVLDANRIRSELEVRAGGPYLNWKYGPEARTDSVTYSKLAC